MKQRSSKQTAVVFRKKMECEKQFYKGNKLNYAVTIMCLILNTGMSISLAFILQYFIEGIEYADTGSLKKGGIAVAVFLGFYVIALVLEKKYKNTYMRRALAQFKEYVFKKMLGKSIAQYENGMSAQFISAFSNDLNSIEKNYLLGMLEIILTTLMFAGAAGTMLVWNLKIAVPVLVVSLLFIFLSLKYGERLVKKEGETSEENMDFVAQVKDLLNGFIVIKCFKAEKEALQIFHAKNNALEKTKEERRITADTVDIFGNIASILVNLLIFVLGFSMAFKGEVSLGMVIGFIQLGNYILNPVRTLATHLSNKRAAVCLIERIEEAVEQEDRITGSMLEEFKQDIMFQNVSFGYDGTKEVLKNISLTFEKGKKYAIVGSSGSGKSTLLKLILGHNTQYEGNVLIDGMPVKEINTDSLYDRIAIVQQDVFLFDNSIIDNITMFKNFAEEKVAAAVEKAGLSSLLAAKGEAYSCGEGGRNLSGGEKQRVSIARCLVRETPILLIDEATAALDNETAMQVENAILDMEGLTRLVVTHRFNEISLRKYDEIVVLGKGNLIEQGNFECLMQKKGYFYSLYSVSQVEGC